MLIDDSATFHDGCEACGESGKTPYYEGHGFLCGICADIKGAVTTGKYKPFSCIKTDISDIESLSNEQAEAIGNAILANSSTKFLLKSSS